MHTSLLQFDSKYVQKNAYFLPFRRQNKTLFDNFQVVSQILQQIWKKQKTVLRAKVQGQLKSSDSAFLFFFN